MWMQRVLDFWAANELIHTQHASPPESHGRTTETSRSCCGARKGPSHLFCIHTPFSRAKALLLLLGGC